MATRKAAQPQVKPTVVIDNETQRVDEARSRFFDAFEHYQEALGIPTPRRAFVSFCVSLIASAATGLAIGKLTTMLMVGAAMLTGSAFLVMLIWIVGLVLSIYCGVKTFSAAFNYVAQGEIDKDAVRAKAWVGDKASTVRGWFTKSQPQVA